MFASALGEISCRTKAKTKARSYLPSKLDKYTIRLYCVVEWKTIYLHTAFDNASGNSRPLTAAERYCEIFPDFRTPLIIFCGNSEDKSSSLWVEKNYIHRKLVYSKFSLTKIAFNDKRRNEGNWKYAFHKVGRREQRGRIKRDFESPFVQN